MSEMRKDEALVFAACKNGEADWQVFVENFRGELFDYLIRMSGQADRSVHTVDEVMNVMAAEASRFETFESLLLTMFVTARNFSADIWNADTSKLTIDEFSGNAVEIKQKNRKAKKAFPSIRRADESLSALAGPVREILILHLRHGFDYDEIGQIMMTGADVAEQQFESARQILEAALPDLELKVAEAITLLPKHEPPPLSLHQTKDLNIVIRDLKSVRGGTWSWKTVLLVLFFAVIGAAVGFATKYWLQK